MRPRRIRLGRRQRALARARRLGCQRGGPLEKRRRGGQPAPRLRAAGRPLELGGDILVRAGRRLGQVPRPPVGIDLRVGRLGQRPVHLAPSFGAAAR